MKKSSSFKDAINFSELKRKHGFKVGFVVGCFDVLHLGHLKLFSFAKKHSDFLIVGLDNDLTIRESKGKNRPINTARRRISFLNQIRSIDNVFLIKDFSVHGTKKSEKIYEKLLKKINPTCVFTNKNCDRYWNRKKYIAKKLNIKFIADNSKRITNSGTIIKILEGEF